MIVLVFKLAFFSGVMVDPPPLRLANASAKNGSFIFTCSLTITRSKTQKDYKTIDNAVLLGFSVLLCNIKCEYIEIV